VTDIRGLDSREVMSSLISKSRNKRGQCWILFSSNKLMRIPRRWRWSGAGLSSFCSFISGSKWCTYVLSTQAVERARVLGAIRVIMPIIALEINCIEWETRRPLFETWETSWDCGDNVREALVYLKHGRGYLHPPKDFAPTTENLAFLQHCNLSKKGLCIGSIAVDPVRQDSRNMRCDCGAERDWKQIGWTHTSSCVASLIWEEPDRSSKGEDTKTEDALECGWSRKGRVEISKEGCFKPRVFW